MKKKVVIALAAAFAFVCTSAFAQEQEQVQKTIAVVVPFESGASGVPQEEVDVVYQMFLSEFVGTGKCAVVDRGSFDKAKAQLAFKAADLTDNDKVAKLGKTLNASVVVTGQIMKFRNELMFIVQALDVDSAQVISSVDEHVYDVSELFGKFKEICKTLFKKIAVAQNTVADDYEIGDIGPGGGIVFYYSEEGFTFYESHTASPRLCHYLECSSVELGLIPWCPCENGKSCNVYMSVGTVGAGVGKLFTNSILNAKQHTAVSLTPSNCAAKACAVYATETTKAGEWYLPSDFELDLMYKNLRKSGKITSDSWHLSSSQYYYAYSYSAIARSFSNGGSDSNTSKGYRAVVRAVRAF